MIRVELPWPPAALFPNKALRRTGHFAYKDKAKLMRQLAWGLTVQQMQRAGIRLREYQAPPELVLHYEFTPPLRRGKVADEDNTLAALKPARDGIASALGVDDSRFRSERPIWRERAGEGQIVISFQ